MTLILLLCGFDFFRSPVTTTKLTGVEVDGRLVDGNVLVDLNFTFNAGTDKKNIFLFKGEYALIDHDLHDRGKLEVKDKELYVSFSESGKQNLRISLSVDKQQKGRIISSSFRIPDYQVRQVKFNTGTEDIDLKLNSLLRTEKFQNKAGEWLYSGFMKLGEEFELSWQPKVERLEKELSLTCQKHSVVSVGVGSLKVDSLYDYQIVQGAASQLLFKVPDSFNVSKVHSKSAIRDWQIIGKDGQNILIINLRNSEAKSLSVKIEGEQALGSFPAQANVSFLEPMKVLRVSGFVALGANSAVKILVNKSIGLSQVEPVSFQNSIKKNFSQFPNRSLFVYNFAAMPIHLSLALDKIEPVIFTDSQLNYLISEASLQLRGRIESEIRDSSIRELSIFFDSRLSLTNISVADLKDYEVFEKNGQKKLVVYFRKPIMGKRLLDVTLEWSHRGWRQPEILPQVYISNTRTARGFVTISATDGLVTNISSVENLRQVPVASLPTRSLNIQSAWRFKEAVWTGKLEVKKKKSSLYSELFHLYSLGENVIYGSVSITTHISGAPVDQLRVKVPGNYKNIELVGRFRPRLYKNENNEWLVKLQKKINGDYTLLMTFEVNHSTVDSEFFVGGVELPGSDSESGFITVSGPTGIKATTLTAETGLLPVETDQVPAAYKLLHSHPVHLAYKYVKAPHLAKISLKSYESVNLLDLVVEHSKMTTKVNQNGERVTEVECWVKNSSRQHLSLQLPSKSSFWSCSVDGKQVRCTSQGDTLQVPVPRNSDPNTTIHVKYSYAEVDRELKGGELFEMSSPRYSVPGVFNEWQVQLPGGFSIFRQDGSMGATSENHLNSRVDTIGVMKSFVGWATRHGKQHSLTFVFGLFILGLCLRIKQVKVFGAILGTILILWGGINLASANPLPVQRSSQPSYQVMNYKKTVSAANEVQKISGILKDNSVAVSGESKPGLVYFALALVFLIGLVKYRNFLLPFGAMVSVWLGCLGNSMAEYSFALFLCLFLPVVFVLAINRIAHQLLSRISQRKSISIAVLLLLCVMVPDVHSKGKEVIAYPMVNFASYEVSAEDKTAMVKGQFDLDGEVGSRYLILKSPCALISTEYDQKRMKLDIVDGQCFFEILKKGKTRININFEVPVKFVKEGFKLKFFKPNSKQNTVRFQVNTKEIQEISANNSIYFSKSKIGNSAQALFKNQSHVSFYWRPAEKKISEIPAVYFADTKSFSLAGEGSFDLEHIIDLKISKGQVKNLQLQVPVNQTVTLVAARGLTNWAFNPKTKLLNLVFSQGLRDFSRFVVTTQIQNPGLMKDIEISTLKVEGATRQYGLLALGSQEGLKGYVKNKQAVQEIDSMDFPEKLFGLAKKRQKESALFCYSYRSLPMNVLMKALKVKAEVEVHETASFSIGDERLVFNSQLVIEVKKAGVFELRLLLPDEYEVESLTANGISHWDEIKEKSKRQLILYFKNRIKGKFLANLVLVKSSERKATSIVVPKFSVVEEKRHKGSLVVSAEQGNRLEIDKKSGVGRVVLVNDGSMSMALLRQDWSLTLSREVLAPRIEVETLESISFADTRYKVNGRVILKIENAGTKFLTLKGFAQIQNLEIRGKDIARTEKVKDGSWQVEFKRKIFGEYRLNYQYQTYYDSSQQVELQGIQFEGVNRQRGFLCMSIPAYMSGSISETNDLQTYESRLLPASLATPEDKRSTLCFRTLQSKWICSMAFIRHSKAEILQANVQDVQIQTMVALDGRQLHVVNIAISSGVKNFLKMKLPSNSHVCSVFSNGKPLEISSQEEDLLIPLNQSLPGESRRELQVIYISEAHSFDWQMAKFEGPQFDLPLKEINWYLYVPDEKKYDEFTGTMKYVPEAYYFTNSIDKYLKKSKADQQMSREQANVLLEQAYKWSNSGRRDLARKNYEAVVSLSESMSDINEDARVQLQTTLRQQTLVGLVNRRENLKASTSGEAFDFDERNYNGGYFSDSFAKAVEKTLEEEESRLLSKVSDKIMSQQAAASRQVMPLKLTLPKEGRQLHFYRQVQIEPMAPMNVSFESVAKLSKVPVSDKAFKENAIVLSLLLLGSLFMMGGRFKKQEVA